MPQKTYITIQPINGCHRILAHPSADTASQICLVSLAGHAQSIKAALQATIKRAIRDAQQEQHT